MIKRPDPLTLFIAHPSELLTDHLPHGDGLVSFGFLRRLAERGHQVHVAAQRVKVRAAIPVNMHVYELMPESDVAITDRLAFMARMRLLFHRLSRTVEFDLVHQMNPVFTGLSLSLLGIRQPLVLGTFVPRWHSEADAGSRYHPTQPGRIRRAVLAAVARLQQAQASGLLLATPDAISRIAEPERHAERIFEVPHGIDLSCFPERTTVPGKPSILFLANVIQRKGIFTLLDAFVHVAGVVPGVELVIAGDGGDLDQVQARAAQLQGLPIRILGRVDRADVPALMRAHSLYCLPSYGEPFATSILEAMACGVPIVATRAGGVPYVVGEAGGRLVPPRDPAALADALVEVLTSPPLQRAMGRQNRERLEDHFEVEGAVDRLEAAYAAILRASRSNRSGRVRPAPVNASGSSGRRWHGNWP